jgi:hypothetical protein
VTIHHVATIHHQFSGGRTSAPAKYQGNIRADTGSLAPQEQLRQIINDAFDGRNEVDIRIKGSRVKLVVRTEDSIVTAEMHKIGNVAITSKSETPLRHKGDASRKRDALALKRAHPSMTQNEIAEKVGVSQPAVSKWFSQP